jgi:hypothetical protein
MCTFVDYISAVIRLPKDEFIDAKHPIAIAEKYGSCRTTEHSIFVSIGGSTIKSNDHAREMIAFLKEHGFKITRVDFAIDVLEKLNLDDIYQQALKEFHDSARVGKDGKTRHFKPYPTIWSSAYGSTVYLGKRHSERMLRIYDKRGEIQAKQDIDIGFDITRIELEVKGRLVNQYLLYLMSGQTAAIDADIAARYGLDVSRFPKKLVRTLVNEEKADVFAIVRRYHKALRQAWDTDHCKFMHLLGLREEATQESRGKSNGNNN